MGTIGQLLPLNTYELELHREKEQNMPGLSVTEKSHWKDRIGRRIDKRIEVISAGEPNLMDRVQRQARRQALQSLGIADLQTELDAIEEQKLDLDRRQDRVHRSMLATVRCTA